MAPQFPFRNAFHPTPAGLVLGVLLLLAQSALWFWFLMEMGTRPPRPWRAAAELHAGRPSSKPSR